MANNAFDQLRDDTGGSWNIARREVEESFKLSADKKTVKDAVESFANKDVQASQKRVYDSILGDIKSALNVGKTPKREDFINAAKRVEGIINVLGDAAGETTLDPDFISILNQLEELSSFLTGICYTHIQLILFILSQMKKCIFQQKFHLIWKR